MILILVIVGIVLVAGVLVKWVKLGNSKSVVPRRDTTTLRESDSGKGKRGAYGAVTEESSNTVLTLTAAQHNDRVGKCSPDKVRQTRKVVELSDTESSEG